MAVKMDVSNRAKQFLPFAALKGLPEALAEKEKIRVPRPQLSEDYMAELDARMHLIEKGMMITVTYYKNEECLQKTGMVARFDTQCRILQVVDTKIMFEDILDVNILR